MAKRYRAKITADTDWPFGMVLNLYNKNDGDLVLYSDHAAELADAEWRVEVAVGQMTELQKELAALKEAVRPVVGWWEAVRARDAEDPEWDEPLTPNVLYLEAIGTEATGSRYVSVEKLDDLARLCGEE